MRTTIALAGLAALFGCGGGSEPTTTVSIAVEFPNQAVEVSTNSLHFWILSSADDTAPGCADLRGGDATPYDLVFDRLADLVVITANGETGSAEGVARGPALVYVEGVDFFGTAHLAGCQAVKISGSDQSVSVPLSPPGTYDCSDPATKEGAPCDDGMFCTVGETCSGGTCQGGHARDCTQVADQCNAEACSEAMGCHPSPVPNGRPCEDGLYCTVGDSCQDGKCTAGGDRDCSSYDSTCHTGTCDESLGSCRSTIDDALSCSDGYYCTTGDVCSSGFCGGTAVDCSAAADDCNTAACSEGSLGACVRTPTRQGLSCNSNCTVGGTCDAGVCTGGTAQTPGTEGPKGDPTCSDYIDNDCDTLLDGDDPDCQ